MKICAFVFLSNHYHLLLRVDSAKQLADFMGYFNSNRRFLGAFREAAEQLRAGDRSALFPDGCFPPALPFVGGG
jgi:REP element-mobilizing transposase RayT